MRNGSEKRTGARAWALAAVLAASLGAGCAGIPGNVFLAKDFASPRTAYGDALRRNTRSAELYQGFDTVAKAWATWRNDDVRNALVEASIAAYGLKGDEAGALRRDEREAAARGREFHLALYTPRKEWNDLDSPSTLWRAYLKLPDGSRSAPVEIVFLPKSDKNIVEYPYVTRWTREYRLLFPQLDEREIREGATLLLTGPLGTMKLEF